MAGTTPGPDERRMRQILKQRGVGYDAAPPPVPPLPPGYDPRPRDWFDDLADYNAPKPSRHTKPPTEQPTPAPADQEHPAAENAPPESGWWQAQPGYWPHPHTPAFITRTLDRVPDRPDIALKPKTRAALYNISAAGAGWSLGLYHQFAGALADCGTNYSIGGALVLGAGGCLLIAHIWDRRTRHWWPGIAWVARIPLATAITALALWAPAAP